MIVDAIGEGLNRSGATNKCHEVSRHGLTIAGTVLRIPVGMRPIGFSAMFSGERRTQRGFITALRARIPAAVFVADGEHITAFLEFSLGDCRALDLVVRGKGENVLRSLRGVLRGARRHGPERRCLHRCGGALRREFGRAPDLGHRQHSPALLAGHTVISRSSGRREVIRRADGVRRLHPRITRLPVPCRFCSSPQMWIARYILRGANDVIAETKHYIARYKSTAFQFYGLTAMT